MIMNKKRGPGKIKTDIGTDQLYEFYLGQLDKIESIKGGETFGSYKINQVTYSKILKDINTGIVNLMIFENFDFKIPCNLGNKSVKQRKIKIVLNEKGELDKKYLSPDWGATRKLWADDPEAHKKKTVIYHTNDHTNNYKMSYEWSKRRANAIGTKVYFFFMCREKKRYLKTCLKENPNLQFYEPVRLRKQAINFNKKLQ